MVHALEEIRRVLASGGVLIDLRPRAGCWPVEVVSNRGFQATGYAKDLPEQVEGDVASNKAMKEVEARGWFRREQEDSFPFFYSWDSPAEMEEFIAEEWPDFIELGEDVKKATRSIWAIGDADSRVRLRRMILITRWKKTTDADLT